jgi:hypothetical protein
MQPPDGCRSRYTCGKPTVIPSVDTNVNGLRVAVLKKFGVGHGEHFLDVHLHFRPTRKECKNTQVYANVVKEVPHTVYAF